VISPDLVRQIYRYAQDPYASPPPSSSDAALLPLFESGREFIVARIRQEGLPVQVYGHVVWTAVSLLTSHMQGALIALREDMPALGEIWPHSGLETGLVLPVLGRAVHDHVGQVGLGQVGLEQQQPPRGGPGRRKLFRACRLLI
jgi:hypothetical protein